jgi:hypothetical protein
MTPYPSLLSLNALAPRALRCPAVSHHLAHLPMGAPRYAVLLRGKEPGGKRGLADRLTASRAASSSSCRSIWRRRRRASPRSLQPKELLFDLKHTHAEIAERGERKRNRKKHLSFPDRCLSVSLSRALFPTSPPSGPCHGRALEGASLELLPSVPFSRCNAPSLLAPSPPWVLLRSLPRSLACVRPPSPPPGPRPGAPWHPDTPASPGGHSRGELTSTQSRSAS